MIDYMGIEEALPLHYIGRCCVFYLLGFNVDIFAVSLRSEDLC